ncbi:hypothetical protein FHG87_004853 [Trinorchestia longiramus]|nr:hypothetical protein FHG87_004853 [Trinorchestia longiramus]
MHYDIPFDKTIQNVVTLLQAHTSACVDSEKKKKLVYLTCQLKLLLQKQFSMNGYCFALQSHAKCNYEQPRDFLVLPFKRKLQYITSSIDKDQVPRETFDKVQIQQQKNVFLLVDEVQISPTVSFSGVLLSGMAENNRDCKATSILCVMMSSPCSKLIDLVNTNSLQHHVTEPTRRNTIHDLVMTTSDLSINGLEVTDKIGDHPMIDFTLEVQNPNTRTQHKQVLDYKRANFELMKEKLGSNNYEVPNSNKNAEECYMIFKEKLQLRQKANQVNQ